MSLGQNIKKLRELQQVTLEQMASNLKISLEKYEKIELDEVDFSVSQLQNIAHLLKTSPEALFNPEGRTANFHGDYSQYNNYANQVEVAHFGTYIMNDKEFVLEVQERCFQRIHELSEQILQQNEELKKVVDLLQKTMA